MMQIERTVNADPRLSRIDDALPQGFHEADLAELANVEGGGWFRDFCLVSLAVAITVALI